MKALACVIVGADERNRPCQSRSSPEHPEASAGPPPGPSPTEGWSLVLDARGAADLEEVVAELSGHTTVVGGAGRRRRARCTATSWSRRAASSAASTCSSTTPACSARRRSRPSPTTRSTPRGRATGSTSSPRSALVQLALPAAAGDAAARSSNVTSDAAVEGYEGWGGYGSSKAALEQLTNVLAAEEPGVRVYRFDPGDMRTQMHQEAFPGEDISDRPEPEDASCPRCVRLLEPTPAERPLPGRRPAAKRS